MSGHIHRVGDLNIPLSEMKIFKWAEINEKEDQKKKTQERRWIKPKAGALKIFIKWTKHL